MHAMSGSKGSASQGGISSLWGSLLSNHTHAPRAPDCSSECRMSSWPPGQAPYECLTLFPVHSDIHMFAHLLGVLHSTKQTS